MTLDPIHRIDRRPKNQVQERSTGDVLSILEKVDDRLASLERHMAPIRRVGGWVIAPH
jgi:hypothetical protein